MDIRLQDVRVRLGRRTVLDIPALEVRSGKVTVVMGQNGAGKTTLLRLIAGLASPDRGQVFLGRQPANSGRTAVSRQVAIAFQRPVFLRGTLGANFELALRLQGVSSPERRERVARAAEALGIAHILQRQARTLSGGEAQRANLARALAVRAPITLLDEPLAGMDPPTARDLLLTLPGVLREHTQTAVVVSHNREEALRLADDLVVLAGGRVAAAGPRDDVLRAPPDPGTAALLGYSLLVDAAGVVAVAPGKLVVGPGPVPFELRVASVVDLGTHIEVAGWVGEAPAGARLAGGPPPQPGDRVAVSAAPGDTVRFPGVHGA